MSAKILITGGSGLIGTSLTQLLLNKGYEVAWLSRSGKAINGVKGYYWNIETGEIDENAFTNTKYIVHLAGESIADKRWTKKQKDKILLSRTKSAELLRKTLINGNHKIEAFISASGIGYYGYYNQNNLLTENAEVGNDFVANVVKGWESSADEFNILAERVVKLRVGLVLAKEGGALQKMATPTQLGLGAILGNGKQIMSWIHIDDLCSMFYFAIENNKISGVYNAVSTNPVSNRDFTKILAKTIKRPLWLPNIPSFVLKLLFGEMYHLLVGSGRVSPEKIQQAGFIFKYSEISTALNNLLKTK